MSSTRRTFLKTSALTGAGLLLPLPHSTAQESSGEDPDPAPTESPNEALDIGVIGVANRGNANLNGVAGENVVALCDIDDHYLAAAGQRFPGARRYNDFRRMLDRERLDAIVVSTPDHTHAVAAMAGLKRGLHVYCEKPLAHSVEEARLVAEAAKEHGCVTQMGTQIHAGDNYRRVVELDSSCGAIGPDPRSARLWCGKGWSADRDASNSAASRLPRAPQLGSLAGTGTRAEVLPQGHPAGPTGGSFWDVRHRNAGRHGLPLPRFDPFWALKLQASRPAV